LICRAGGGPCERIETPGPWLGAARRIDKAVVDVTGALRPGDLMALYTDGVIECKEARGQPFGIDRLCALIEQNRTDPAEALSQRVGNAVAQWSFVQEDDYTAVFIRSTGRRPTVF